jgi:ferredoxin
MPDRTDKLPRNVTGAFYVDGQCIDCDLCRQVAPANFDRHAAGGYSFVSKQPSCEAEVQLCRQALEECPVEAIGDDGL